MSRTFNKAALQDRSVGELRALYHAEMRRLIRSERGSPARHDALSNLETISLAIARRYAAGPGP
jgi:hypothetical protein